MVNVKSRVSVAAIFTCDTRVGRKYVILGRFVEVAVLQRVALMCVLPDLLWSCGTGFVEVRNRLS